MDSHIKVLGILHIIYGALGLAIGVVGFLFFGGIGALIGVTQASPDALVAVPILGGIGLIALLFFALLSIPEIIAGYGLIKYRPWARILTIVLSCLDLFNVPVGTALAIYGFWVLLSQQGSAMFEQERLRPY